MPCVPLEFQCNPLKERTMAMVDPVKLAEIRADLVKELFPIVIAVGFVERVSHIEWLLSGAVDNLSRGEIADLLHLLIGTALAIFAWDWYHRDIKISEVSVWRYLLDVLIVLGYLLFMLTQEHQRTWMITLVLIFALWIVLDSLGDFQSRELHDK
jgi:hypothetical protein